MDLGSTGSLDLGIPPFGVSGDHRIYGYPIPRSTVHGALYVEVPYYVHASNVFPHVSIPGVWDIHGITHRPPLGVLGPTTGSEG